MQLDYVPEFLPEPIEKELYMKILKGFELDSEVNTEEQVLKLHNDVYIQK